MLKIPIPDPVPVAGLKAALAVTGELHRQLLKLIQAPLSAAETLFRARRLIQRHEPILARTLRDSFLAAWLKAARRWSKDLPEVQTPGLPPPPFSRPSGPNEPDEPLVRFPMIEQAAASLARKGLMLPDDFQNLDQDASRTAFTVARATSLETVKRVHQALIEDIREGGTLPEFAERLDEVLSPILSRPQIETIYRTHVMQAYSAGQREVLNHPLIRDEFPYLMWTAVHDSRVRAEHLAMEKFGLDGTAVFRADDPMWVTLTPPAAWNCRCHALPLSIEDAARYGVREAKEWVRTGQPPETPHWVSPPYPITPPPGWPTSGQIATVL